LQPLEYREIPAQARPEHARRVRRPKASRLPERKCPPRTYTRRALGNPVQERKTVW
jgi:hypothetical protein